MKYTTGILFIALLALTALNIHAQTEKKEGEEKHIKIDRTQFPVYLGHSKLTGGAISKTLFDSLLKQGLTASDSVGHPFKVAGFMLTYAEVKLYEDAVGTLFLTSDYHEEYCPGDTLTSFLAHDDYGNLFDRTKKGDTVYFDQVKLIRPDGKPAAGKSMTFMIRSN